MQEALPVPVDKGNCDMQNIRRGNSKAIIRLIRQITSESGIMQTKDDTELCFAVSKVVKCGISILFSRYVRDFWQMDVFEKSAVGTILYFNLLRFWQSVFRGKR